MIKYGIENNLIKKEDKVYVRNRIYNLLNINEPKNIKFNDNEKIILKDVLDEIIKYALEKNIIKEDMVSLKDVFDSELMNILMDKPSYVIKDFKDKYKNSPKRATDWFYKLNFLSNYIRKDRVSKNLKWKTNSEYGPIEITINMSKPEKSPEEIKLASKQKDNSYPKCYLCKENEGYQGRIDYPGRANHRIIPLDLNNKNWFFQYSPYSYFNEHAIVFKETHDPMHINHETFKTLLSFVNKFKHYFLGSNADLPIVGGSILSHDHFQGGNYNFPIEDAKVLFNKTYNNIDLEILKWPLSVIRLKSNNKDKLADFADKITKKWRKYEDQKVNIIPKTDENHNTVTPIVRFKEEKFEIDLVLRNNRTTEKYPLGIFHPHSEVHHIKKENIGLIEVMGLAVLPKRLKQELNQINEILLLDKKIPEKLKHHKNWIERMKEKYKNNDKLEIERNLEKEVGEIFTKVLEYAGVFKQNKEGINRFKKFVDTI